MDLALALLARSDAGRHHEVDPPPWTSPWPSSSDLMLATVVRPTCRGSTTLELALALLASLPASVPIGRKPWPGGGTAGRRPWLGEGVGGEWHVGLGEGVGGKRVRLGEGVLGERGTTQGSERERAGVCEGKL
jgi:hypothetical protein